MTVYHRLAGTQSQNQLMKQRVRNKIRVGLIESQGITAHQEVACKGISFRKGWGGFNHRPIDMIPLR